jgi:hypothetical protein
LGTIKAFKKIRKQVKTMSNTILALENRINLLRGRDPVGNVRIIRKLERRLRALQKSEI